jgi:hypothetical protein
MKTSFYWNTIRDCTVQFLDTLNDIVINRYNASGEVVSTLPVCVKFAPKQKIQYFLTEQTRKNIKLPIISVFIQSVNYARERANDYMHEYQMPVNPTSADEVITSLKTPIPYDIIYQTTIWTSYQEDLNQILERILTWTAPFLYVSIKEPITNNIVNCKIMQNNTAPEIELDYGDEDQPVLRWGIDFTCQTWLWKPVTTAGLIHYIKIYNKIIESRALSGSANLYSTLSLSGISAASAASGAGRLYEYEKIDEYP